MGWLIPEGAQVDWQAWATFSGALSVIIVALIARNSVKDLVKNSISKEKAEAAVRVVSKTREMQSYCDMCLSKEAGPALDLIEENYSKYQEIYANKLYYYKSTIGKHKYPELDSKFISDSYVAFGLTGEYYASALKDAIHRIETAIETIEVYTSFDANAEINEITLLVFEYAEKNDVLKSLFDILIPGPDDPACIRLQVVKSINGIMNCFEAFPEQITPTPNYVIDTSNLSEEQERWQNNHKNAVPNMVSSIRSNQL